MLEEPLIGIFKNEIIDDLHARFNGLQLLAEESRHDFTATFPKHNRFFKNGDKPLIVLIKHKGHVALKYDGQGYIINDGEFVFFDDNVPHAWVMEHCDLDIYYFRLPVTISPITKGDYCLDDYFT